MKSPYNFKNIKKFTQGLIVTSLLYSTIIYAGTPVIKIAIRELPRAQS